MLLCPSSLVTVAVIGDCPETAVLIRKQRNKGPPDEVRRGAHKVNCHAHPDANRRLMRLDVREQECRGVPQCRNALRALLDPSVAPVLVHCRHRSVTRAERVTNCVSAFVWSVDKMKLSPDVAPCSNCAP